MTTETVWDIAMELVDEIYRLTKKTTLSKKKAMKKADSYCTRLNEAYWREEKRRHEREIELYGYAEK